MRSVPVCRVPKPPRAVACKSNRISRRSSLKPGFRKKTFRGTFTQMIKAQLTSGHVYLPD
jgi:hypothetical protein